MSNSVAGVTLTGNVAAWTLLKKCVKPRHADAYGATIIAAGTWGSGTLALGVSADGGTTVAPVMNSSQVAVTMTADGSLNLSLNVGNSDNEALGIYYKFTGSTTPSVKVNCSDNKN